MKINSYEVWIKDYPDTTRHIYTATTPSKARYQSYLSAQDAGWNVRLIDFRSRKLPNLVTDSSFEHCKNIRNMPFVELGMKISCDGKVGYIVGANGSAGWNVVFEDGHEGGCHPRWQMIYYDKDGNVIAEYLEKTPAEGQARLDAECLVCGGTARKYTACGTNECQGVF